MVSIPKNNTVKILIIVSANLSRVLKEAVMTKLSWVVGGGIELR